MEVLLLLTAVVSHSVVISAEPKKGRASFTTQMRQSIEVKRDLMFDRLSDLNRYERSFSYKKSTRWRRNTVAVFFKA